MRVSAELCPAVSGLAEPFGVISCGRRAPGDGNDEQGDGADDNPDDREDNARLDITRNAKAGTWWGHHHPPYAR